FVADVGVGGDEVGQDECLDVGGLRHGADAVGGGVAVEQVLAQVGAGGAGKYPVQSRFVVDFVDEDVGALRQFDQRRAFGGVAAEDDGAVRCVEAVGQRYLEWRVIDRRGGDGEFVGLQHDAGCGDFV